MRPCAVSALADMPAVAMSLTPAGGFLVLFPGGVCASRWPLMVMNRPGGRVLRRNEVSVGRAGRFAARIGVDRERDHPHEGGLTGIKYRLCFAR